MLSILLISGNISPSFGIWWNSMYVWEDLIIGRDVRWFYRLTYVYCRTPTLLLTLSVLIRWQLGLFWKTCRDRNFTASTQLDYTILTQLQIIRKPIWWVHFFGFGKPMFAADLSFVVGKFCSCFHMIVHQIFGKVSRTILHLTGFLFSRKFSKCSLK